MIWPFNPAPPATTRAQPADAEAIARIHKGAFARGWSSNEIEALLADKSVTGAVLKHKKMLIGFILSRGAVDEAEVLSIALEGNQRGKGHAKTLLSYHLAQLAAQGTKALFLEVEEGNLPALYLYRSFGFQEIGRRKNYYQNEKQLADALVMRRSLD